MKPLLHSLVTMCTQFPPVVIELLDELATTDDELLELVVELLLETEFSDELLAAVSPTMPQGAGCDSQVERAIQLRFCSQPQPLWVVTQRGYKVPYQLHCCAPAEDETDDALFDETLLLDEDVTLPSNTRLNASNQLSAIN